MSRNSSEYVFETFGVSLSEAAERSSLLLSEGSSFLSSIGWKNLLVPTEDEFDYSFNLLRSGEITECGNIFDFYHALFHTSNAFSSSPAMFSILPRQLEDGTWSYQRYEVFDLNDNWDCELMLSSFETERMLIFPGLFNYDFRINAELSNLYALNAFVVDIDPKFLTSNDKTLVECPLTVDNLKSIINSLPNVLQPTHICLTGNGVHLWYVLDKSINIGRTRNPRRAKWIDFKERFALYLQERFSSIPVSIDPNDKVLSHGYRPPGSKTKHGLRSCCFRNPNSKLIDIVSFSRALSLLDSVSGSSASITEDDIVWLSKDEFVKAREEQKRLRHEELVSSPATEKQINYLVYLASLCGSKKSINDFIDMNMLEAGEAIGSFKKKIAKEKIAENKEYLNLPMPEGWSRAPHPLNSGKEGGVYGVIYKNITRVAVGKRYMALVMLAGVAYMMSNPPKPIEEVKKDFIALLDTPWANQGNPPLTAKEIESALKGYKESNIRSKKGIIDVLGFDPFLPPAKRNGRTRAEHLQVYVPPMRKKKLHDKNLELINEARRSGFTTKAEVARKTGLSYPTVLKYWDECSVALPDKIKDAADCVKKARDNNPSASKSEIARICGLSRPTVIKYWES